MIQKKHTLQMTPPKTLTKAQQQHLVRPSNKASLLPAVGMRPMMIERKERSKKFRSLEVGETLETK
jgi:hypothetical protein